MLYSDGILIFVFCEKQALAAHGGRLLGKPVVVATAPIHASALDMLRQVAEVQIFDPPLISEDEVAEVVRRLKPAVIIAVRGAEHIGRRVFDADPDLLLVARNGIGYERIDVRAATEYGVWVTVTPVEELFEATAEHAIALILCLARKICQADRDVRKGLWLHEGLLGVSINNKVVGIVGLGRIGRRIAAKACALGMDVVYYSRTRKPELEEALGISYRDLSTLLKISDFVVVAVPLTPETANMIGENELRLMKRSAYLINIARGGVVDYNALVKAVKDGWIAGVALDVFPEEPLPGNSPLRAFDNVVLTPHIAWFTEDARRAMAKCLAEDVMRVLRCEEPLHPVNKEVRDKALDKCRRILKHR